MRPEDWGKGDHRRLAARDVPAAVLDLVDRKQGGRFCVLCRRQGLVTPDDDPLVLDHLQPLSEGGDNHFGNLRWLCRSHNARRSARGADFNGEPAWAIRPRGR